MRKVLILAHDFYPLRTAGAQRPYSWFMYLKRFHWDPLVVTRHWDPGAEKPLDFARASSQTKVALETGESGRIARVPHRPNFRDRLIIRYGMDRFVIFRKMISFWLSWFRFICPLVDSNIGIYNEARKRLQEEKVDLILATGEPFILFKYAFLLGREFGIPYLLDYRDCWTSLKAHSHRDQLLNAMHRFFFRSFERKYYRAAVKIFTASPYNIPRLKPMQAALDIEVVYNGFFQEDQLGEGLEESKKSNSFRICYSGRFYPFQPLAAFLSVVDRLVLRYPECRLKLCFVGTREGDPGISLIKQSRAWRLNLIEFHPHLPYADYMKLLRGADLLLLLNRVNSEWINAKLFDYMGAGRPVLLYQADDGMMEQMIRETSSGTCCRDEDALERMLDQRYEDFLRQQRPVLSSRGVDAYSRLAQCGKLAQVLDSCVE